MAYEDAVGDGDAECPEIVVECELVECEGFDEYAAGGVGYVQQVEISLQHSVLSRCAVYGDVCVVEMVSLAL